MRNKTTEFAAAATIDVMIFASFNWSLIKAILKSENWWVLVEQLVFYTCTYRNVYSSTNKENEEQQTCNHWIESKWHAACLSFCTFCWSSISKCNTINACKSSKSKYINRKKYRGRGIINLHWSSNDNSIHPVGISDWTVKPACECNNCKN